MKENFPHLIGKPVRIELRTSHEPPQRAMEFLGRARDQLALQNIALEAVLIGEEQQSCSGGGSAGDAVENDLRSMRNIILKIHDREVAVEREMMERTFPVQATWSWPFRWLLSLRLETIREFSPAFLCIEIADN